MSDLAIDSGDLYVLSQKCKTISKVARLTVDQAAPEFEKVYQLPKKVKKPEALLVRGDSFFVGSDIKKKKKPNLFQLARDPSMIAH